MTAQAAAGAGVVARGLDAGLAALVEHQDELGRLDAVAGDGDHGTGMVRGMRAAVAAGSGDTPGAVLRAAGAAFMDAAGGASGALLGTALQTAGRSLADAGEVPGAADVAAALADGLSALQRLGGAQPGDKTMVDTLQPFIAAFTAAAEEGASVADAWRTSLGAARRGAESTRDLVSRRGRASRVGSRSAGSPDPGAMSVLYALEAVRP
jgi:dihydroxyacetone kinase phosphoprotein-dependent L subunit